jgi:hypothetical protein
MAPKPTVTMFAVAACAAVSLGLQVPIQAHATPSPDCDWTVFATDSDIHEGNGRDVHVTWGANSAGADFPIKSGIVHLPIDGPIIVKGTNELEFSISGSDEFGPFTSSYGGSINPNGSASGTSGGKSQSATWTMGPTFKCIAKAASAPPPAEQQAPPPPVEQVPPPEKKPPTNAVKMTIAKSGLTNVNVNVTSTAEIPGSCTYDANEINGLGASVNQAFDLAAKGSKQLSFLAPLPGQTYHVVLSCHGDFNGQDVEFGHQEQNFP